MCADKMITRFEHSLLLLTPIFHQFLSTRLWCAPLVLIQYVGLIFCLQWVRDCLLPLAVECYARTYQALTGPKVFPFRVIAKKSRISSLGLGHYKSTMHLAFFVSLVLIWGEAYSVTIGQFYQSLTPILYATSRFFVRCIIKTVMMRIFV